MGGTKTSACIADEKGNVTAIDVDGPGNFQTVGTIRALSSIKRAVMGALEKAGLSKEDVTFAFFGVAGADTDYDRSVVKKILGEIDLEKYDYEDDGFIALRSAFLDGTGIVVTCGTGSISYAFDGKNYNRIGGYSFFFGERLGAYYVAGLVISAAMRAKDGRGRETVLLKMIEDKADAPIEDLTIYSHAQDLEPPFDLVPTLISMLKKAYQKGDAVAHDIVDKIINEIAIIVKAHESKLDFQGKPAVALEGSCFKALGDILPERLKERLPSHTLKVPEHDPVVGAVMLAMERAGKKVTQEIYERLVISYMEAKR